MPHASLTILALCVATLLAPAARAASNAAAAGESPAASTASAETPGRQHRRLEFRARHNVPTQFTLADPDHAPVGNGFRFETRFGGQAQVRDCSIDLPKAGQLVKPGETTVGTIQCAAPWSVDDDGLSYEAFEHGNKIGGGTLRP